MDTAFLSQASATELFDEIADCDAATVALTDDAARATAIELMQRGLFNYLRKPPAMREFKPMLKRAKEHVVMKRALEGRTAWENGAVPPAECDKLIGSSEVMQGVYEKIKRVANLNTSVLITGESGTGKELIARAIHNLGEREKAPFVAVSCGAIPETLMESELFGHEKGAFTGSAGAHSGLFEQAGGGTLFLDEIGELSLQTQVKLLRVLQQREFTRLGGSRPIPLRARVLFATHRNLEQMIAEKLFRLDLFYRINVVKIDVPSLADRAEDIPSLANHFLRLYSESFLKPVTRISPTAMELLRRYDWPGNIRELENVIQSAIIGADGDVVEACDLPSRLQEQDLEIEPDIAPSGSFERMLREFKLKVAKRAIEECNGNKTLAAQSLDISRAYLHRLIRQPEVESIDSRRMA